MAIEKMWTPAKRNRTLRGHCEDCGKEVHRVQTQDEILGLAAQSVWE
jgi:hypothetical protein